MKLDQFLKWHGLVGTGGEAKQLITTGNILVNGAVEVRRGRKLAKGDLITFGNITFIFEETVTLGRKLANRDQ